MANWVAPLLLAWLVHVTSVDVATAGGTLNCGVCKALVKEIRRGEPSDAC